MGVARGWGPSPRGDQCYGWESRCPITGRPPSSGRRRSTIEDDPAARAVIFDNSHPRERQMDFRRRGVAIVVDLDRVEGRGPEGRLLMVRSSA